MSEPWWVRSTVYQIYPRSFADSNGDGIGDLRGILGRLDYLHTLGVDVIWLSPIYPSPQDDNGYDISDYEDVDPIFGSLADLDELLAAIHDRGMKLVMDLVVNHTSDEHPWFVESRSGRDNPKRDWYWWRPARDGFEPGTPGAEPTNWGSFFSGPAWELDPATGEYYLHLFSRKQPDLNWEHPDVRSAVYEMMRRWLDRGVDGFRMDVVNMLSKDVALPDGLVRAPGGEPLGEPTPCDSASVSAAEHAEQPKRKLDAASGRSSPLEPFAEFGDGWPSFICGPRIHEFLAEMHREVFTGYGDRQLITVGEMPGVTVDQARLFTDPARGEVDMVFQFEHVGIDHGADKWDVRPLDLARLKRSFNRWQVGLAHVGWNSLYWDNHDQPRVVSRFGDDGEHRVRSAKALATVLHMQRGTPYVYQGDELGMTNVAFGSIDDYRDIETLNHHRAALAAGFDAGALMAGIWKASRDNARTPMQWDDSPSAGFTDGTPWIGVNPNHVDINAAAAVADDDSVFHHYRRLIELRRTLDVVALGDFTMLLADDPVVFAFTRRLGDDSLLVVANCSRGRATAAIDDAEDWGTAELVISNYDDRPPLRSSGITLRPWETIVLQRVSGAGSPPPPPAPSGT